MPHDFIPSREAELLNWSRNFREQVSADPGSFGLTPQQAVAYAAAFDRPRWGCVTKQPQRGVASR